MKESYYDILEVSRTASQEVIRAAYKSLVQRFHPDKNPDNPNAVELLKLINNAYETLSDPSKRAAYDVMLTLEEMANPEPERRDSGEEQQEEEGPRQWDDSTESEQSFAERWDLYQTFIDRNPEYYRPIFRKFHNLGTSVSVNVPVFLAGGLWAAYRKLYGISAIHFLLLAAALIGMKFLHGISVALAFFPALLMSIWLGLMGNALFFRSATRKISDISRQSEDSGVAFRKARLAGGVSMIAPLAFVGMAIVAALSTSIFIQEKRIVSRKPVAASAPVAVEEPAPVAEQPAAPPAPPATPIEPPVPTPPPVEKPMEKPVEKPVEKPEAKPVLPRPVEPRHIAPKPVQRPQPVIVQPAPVIENRPPAAPAYSDIATAVSSGDRSAVEKMLKNGEDVNLIKNNQIPLIIAVKNGDLAMARLLLSHGADVNLTDSQGNTAMIYAKIGADPRMIELLKNAGAKNPFK